MIETCKIVRGIYDRQVDPVLTTDTSKMGTRGHKYKLYKKSCQSETRKKAFTMRIVDNWNSLTSELVEAKTTNAFKNGLDNHQHKFPPVLN